MNVRISKRAIPALLILVMATLSCNLVSSTGTATPTLEPVQETPPESEEQTPCYNVLYPVKTGATWTYKSASNFEADYSFTDTITDIREDGFTLTSQFDELTRTQEWACTPDGLDSLTFGTGIAAGIRTSGLQMDLTTNNIQGVNLPNSVNPGDQWSHALDFEGRMDISGASADVKGTATYTFNAIGKETIRVPAGVFDTLKIHAELAADMQINISGVDTPAEFTSSSDVWFAPDIGWVKTMRSGDILDSVYTETIELQSYLIP